MRAERDDDDDFDRPRLVRKKPERRLAYEIAIGIIIGGCVLKLIELASAVLMASVMMQQVKVALPF